MDGSRRWAFFESAKDWGIGFGYLILAQLNVLRAHVALKQTLKFQDNNVDAFIHDVVIMGFSYEPTFASMRGYLRYNAEMSLREA